MVTVGGSVRVLHTSSAVRAACSSKFLVCALLGCVAYTSVSGDIRLRSRWESAIIVLFVDSAAVDDLGF